MSIDAPDEVPLASLDKVAFLDPAGGKAQTKKTSARSAIAVLGQDLYQRIFLLYVWCGRVAVPELVRMLFEINTNFKPRVFGGESDALQYLFQEAVKIIAKDRAEQLPLLPVPHSTRIDKDFRIRTTLQPVLAEGRLIARKDQHEFLAELGGFPMFPTKDIVDCVASGIQLLPQRPRRQQKNEEAEALAAYLRKTGAPAHYIEQRCGDRITSLSVSPMARIMAQNGVLRRPIPKHLQGGNS